MRSQKFGIPDVYAALDWARAYKEFLENWATISKALARFIWNLQVKGGSRSVTAGKTKLNTTLTTNTTTGETNPPSTTGAMFIGSGEDISPIRTAGAQTSPEQGRRLLLMVAAGVGLPETFFGDVATGNLATIGLVSCFVVSC